MGEISGAEAAVRMLQSHGVTHLFGLYGDTSLPFYDALHRLDHGIEHVKGQDSMKTLFSLLVLALAPGERSLAQTPLSEIPMYLVPSVPARIEGMPRALPRAKGPSLAYAIQLAQAAVDACKTRGGKVSVLVADSVGVPVVMFSGDGAGERSQLITSTKAHTVAVYRMPSSKVAEMAQKDEKLRAAIKANPNIGVARGGALPLMEGDDLIGIISVSGFTGMDEICAQEAVAAVPSR